jgi:glycosyltransferase involved in cell wall biosynthesis
MLFVSGTSVGGAARSTSELATELVARGHDAVTLMRDEEARIRGYVHKRAVNLEVKLEGRPGSSAVRAVARYIGRRPRRVASGVGLVEYRAALPENAASVLLRRHGTDVVIANSIERTAWRQLRAELRARGIPSVLYLREESAVGHLSISSAPPDLLLANAEIHAQSARILGHDATVIPSVVDTSRCHVASSRERVVLINPIPTYGVEEAFQLAAARSDVPFTFFESWPLDAGQWSELEQRAAALPNVHLRRFDPDPRRLYAEARVVLVPYHANNRPRVVAEAQANGIPVLAYNRPGIAETVGPGGVLVDIDAPPDAWVEALGHLWDDPATYDRFARAAADHAGASDRRPEAVAERFEQAVAELVANRIASRP